MTNGNRVIRDARKLAERLHNEGRFRMAEIVRALCLTYEQSRRTNRLFYAENSELREQAGLPPTSPPTPTEGAEIVERLLAKRERFVSRAAFKGVEEYHVNPDGPEAATHITTQEAELTRLRQRVAELENSVIAFGAPWAVTYARDFGLPARHLHPTHYDILSEAGARMDDFTRGEPAHQPNGDGAS